MRRAATVLLTAALTAGGLAALAPPPSAADIVAARPHDHGDRPRARAPHLRRSTPTSTSPPASTAARPAPALLVTNGFGGTKDDQADLAQGFGEQGYVTLSYTGIGFVDGDNCPITLDDREHDGAAASQLIRFLGGDPVDRGRRRRDRQSRCTSTRWSARTRRPARRYDPQVGMTGGSYGGQIQFAAAGVRERGRHQPARRDRPADHLERPLLLPGPGEQRPAAGHRAQRLGQLLGHRRLQVPVGGAVHLARRRQRRRRTCDRAARPGRASGTT